MTVRTARRVVAAEMAVLVLLAVIFAAGGAEVWGAAPLLLLWALTQAQIPGRRRTQQ